MGILGRGFWVRVCVDQDRPLFLWLGYWSEWYTAEGSRQGSHR